MVIDALRLDFVKEQAYSHAGGGYVEIMPGLQQLVEQLVRRRASLDSLRAESSNYRSKLLLSAIVQRLHHGVSSAQDSGGGFIGHAGSVAPIDILHVSAGT